VGREGSWEATSVAGRMERFVEPVGLDMVTGVEEV